MCMSVHVHVCVYAYVCKEIQREGSLSVFLLTFLECV